MEFDLCDKDDVDNCLEEILKIPDKFNQEDTTWI